MVTKQEFIVKYDAFNSPTFDIELIQGLQQHGLQYRQLTKGLSLEQQLFA